jgi:hypothetical protein
MILDFYTITVQEHLSGNLELGGDRGRNEGLTSPRPPNRTCGSPASGSPESKVLTVRLDVVAGAFSQTV